MPVETRNGGLPRLTLTHRSGSSAEIYLHGAHVTSWKTADGAEQLFVSERARFAPGEAIRGGIPVVFPQFAGQGPLPKHGLARTRPWTLVDAPPDDPAATFVLEADDATRALWPYDFRLTLRVRLGADSLTVEVAVDNRGARPLPFQAALHTYLRVRAISDARIHGLAGVAYEDTALDGARGLQREDPLRISGEIDRIYLRTPPALLLLEQESAREIRQSGFADTVIWNPGPEKAAALADLGDDEHHRLLCVEAAQIGQAVHLPPGERWIGSQVILRKS